MDNLRIFMDIEIADIYLISSFNNDANTSFGIIRKVDDTWQLELPSVDFDVRLTVEDIYKIYNFIDYLNTEDLLNEPGFPNWSEAPRWAIYAAMDDDGDWYWYESYPLFDSILGEWDAPNKTRFHYITNNPIFKNCGSSLLRKDKTTQGDV